MKADSHHRRTARIRISRTGADSAYCMRNQDIDRLAGLRTRQSRSDGADRDVANTCKNARPPQDMES